MAKYQKYAEYKDSSLKEIGQIPINWNISKIKFLTKCLDGQRIPLNGTERGEKQGNIPYWGANKVVDYLNDWIFDEELILLGEDGAPFFDKSKNVAFAVNEKIWPNNHVHVLRPFKKLGNTKFLTYALNCTDYSLYISGSTRDKLNQSDMDNILIRLPAIIEQTQIANFLDHETAKIDTLITKQEKLIELLKEKRQAVISHAVTKSSNPDVAMKDSGVEWLGEVPEHWSVSLIKYQCREITDGAHISPELENGEYLFVSIRDIKEGVINFDDALLTSEKSYQYLVHTGCMPFEGDILFSKDGTIGQTAITPPNVDFVVASSLIIIRPQFYKVIPEFLDLLLRSDVVQEQVESFVKGAALRRLSIQNLLKIWGVFPPLTEQKELVGFVQLQLEKYKVLEVQAERQVELLRERRTALISAAVTGKIDVRNWESPSKNNNRDNMELSA